MIPFYCCFNYWFVNWMLLEIAYRNIELLTSVRGLFTIYTHSQSFSLSLRFSESPSGLDEVETGACALLLVSLLTGRCQLTLREWNFRMLTTMCYTDLPVYLFSTCKTPGTCKNHSGHKLQFANMLTVSWSWVLLTMGLCLFCEGISSSINIYIFPSFPLSWSIVTVW